MKTITITIETEVIPGWSAFCAILKPAIDCLPGLRSGHMMDLPRSLAACEMTGTVRMEEGDEPKVASLAKRPEIEVWCKLSDRLAALEGRMTTLIQAPDPEARIVALEAKVITLQTCADHTTQFKGNIAVRLDTLDREYDQQIEGLKARVAKLTAHVQALENRGLPPGIGTNPPKE